MDSKRRREGMQPNVCRREDSDLNYIMKMCLGKRDMKLNSLICQMYGAEVGGKGRRKGKPGEICNRASSFK